MEFIVYEYEMMQEEALASFALYDLYCTNMAQDKYLTSEIRTRMEYLINKL